MQIHLRAIPALRNAIAARSSFVMPSDFRRTRQLRRWRAIQTTAVLLVVAACARESGRMPESWGPVARGEDGRCPDLTGRYVYADQPLDFVLAGRLVPWDSVPATLEYFTITGSADTALHVTIGTADGRQHRKRVEKGSEYDGDYHCKDGWLQMNDDVIPDSFDAEVASDGFNARRHAMRIAKGKGGALVARLDRIDYDEFTVWCGDGCKGIPLPWTFTTRSAWSRAVTWADGTPRPSVARGQEELDASERATMLNQRLAREEYLLENGQRVAEPDDAHARTMTAIEHDISEHRPNR
jgi:hypothetical protein